MGLLGKLIAPMTGRVREFIKSFDDGDFSTFKAVFWRYFPRFWKLYALIIALILISSYATAMSAWLVKDVVNDIFVEKKGDYLFLLVGVIVVVFIAKGFATYWQSVLGANIAHHIVADTRRRMFTHFLKQRLTFFESYSSDDLLMRVNNGANAFSQVLNKVLLNGIRDAATVLGLVAVMVIQDPVLTLICLGAVPLVFLAINTLLARIKALAQREMKTFADLNRNVREIVQGAKVIKSYNIEPLFYKQADQAIENIRTISNRVSALNHAPVPIIDTIGGIGIGLTILYAGYRTIYTGYDPGTFMSFVTALLLAQDPARRLSQIRVTLKSSMVGIGMVNQVLHDDRSEPEQTEMLPVSPVGLSIAFRDVQFSYRPGTPVLKNFTLTVKPGEMVALVGPSGAGKSTVFSLLLKFFDHDSGVIEIGGRNINDISVQSLRQSISYVGQNNFIFSGSLRDNLTLGREEVSDDVVIAACRSVGLHDQIMALEKGYDTPAGELGSLISGGQAQRLNIARAIIKDAPILLLDEVTSALDAENEELVRSYMHSQVGKKTVLVIAHRLSTIRQADKIALMEGGRVQAFGSHQELMKGNEYYERVATLQLMA